MSLIEILRKKFRCLALIMITASIPYSSFAQHKIQFKGGGEMYYEEYGEGEPVIFVHGHTLDRRMWDSQVELLKDKYHIIVPDMRGYGLSSDPTDGYQFTHADDILALMDSLGIEKAHIVGLSMGGYAAGDIIALHPERLLSCVMVSGEPCVFTGPSHPRTEKEKEQQRINIRSVKKDVNAYKRRRINSLMLSCHPNNREKIKESVSQQITEWRAWSALHVTGRVYYGTDGWTSLRRNRPNVPAIIIYGEMEKSDCRALEYLPNGKKVVIENCGHMVNMEKPEEFNTILTEWLEENSSE